MSQAKVDEIKEAIEACVTETQVDNVGAEYARDIINFRDGKDAHLRTMAFQIINLAAYQRNIIRQGLK